MLAPGKGLSHTERGGKRLLQGPLSPLYRMVPVMCVVLARGHSEDRAGYRPTQMSDNSPSLSSAIIPWMASFPGSRCVCITGIGMHVYTTLINIHNYIAVYITFTVDLQLAIYIIVVDLVIQSCDVFSLTAS